MMIKFRWSTLIITLSTLPLLGLQAAQPGTGDKVDIFTGVIDNSNLEQKTYLGTITYDRNCIPVDGGLTQCDAGVKTSDKGVINFNYTHKMSKEPCLSPGNEVMMKVQDDRQASVIR